MIKSNDQFPSISVDKYTLKKIAEYIRKNATENVNENINNKAYSKIIYDYFGEHKQYIIEPSLITYMNKELENVKQDISEANNSLGLRTVDQWLQQIKSYFHGIIAINQHNQFHHYPVIDLTEMATQFGKLSESLVRKQSEIHNREKQLFKMFCQPHLMPSGDERPHKRLTN